MIFVVRRYHDQRLVYHNFSSVTFLYAVGDDDGRIFKQRDCPPSWSESMPLSGTVTLARHSDAAAAAATR